MNPITAYTPARDSAPQIEAVIHLLEQHADRHGELIDALLMTPDRLQQCWHEHQQTQLRHYKRSHFRLNLFSENEATLLQDEEETFAGRVYRYWNEHLRQLAHTSFPHQPEAGCMQKICQWISASALQAGLAQKLETALEGYNGVSTASVACASRELNEFITWLGYKTLAPELRPRSRINPGRPIFAPLPPEKNTLPLLRLDEKPSYSNVAYIGDWLVALHARALELSTVSSPTG